MRRLEIIIQCETTSSESSPGVRLAREKATRLSEGFAVVAKTVRSKHLLTITHKGKEHYGLKLTYIF
jgi:hypothetical protein